MTKSIKRVFTMTAAASSAVIPASMALFVAVSLSSASYAGNNIIKNSKADSGESAPDYSGIYKPVDPDVCNIVIVIKKSKGGYSYSINGAGVRSSGRLSVEMDGEQAYLRFNGTLRSGDKTAVEAAYADKKITIQNYGNSMNQYVCFKKCDVKFLEFVKSDK